MFLSLFEGGGRNFKQGGKKNRRQEVTERKKKSLGGRPLSRKEELLNPKTQYSTGPAALPVFSNS